MKDSIVLLALMGLGFFGLLAYFAFKSSVVAAPIAARMEVYSLQRDDEGRLMGIVQGAK